MSFPIKFADPLERNMVCRLTEVLSKVEIIVFCSVKTTDMKSTDVLCVLITKED